MRRPAHVVDIALKFLSAVNAAASFTQLQVKSISS